MFCSGSFSSLCFPNPPATLAVFLFNPLHANRFYVYARAFSLWVQTRSLSSDKPYHVMYFTPGRYNIMNNYEMLRPMTHQGAPLYMYPHSLADKEVRVVSLRAIMAHTNSREVTRT